VLIAQKYAKEWFTDNLNGWTK